MLKQRNIFAIPSRHAEEVMLQLTPLTLKMKHRFWAFLSYVQHQRQRKFNYWVPQSGCATHRHWKKRKRCRVLPCSVRALSEAKFFSTSRHSAAKIVAKTWPRGGSAAVLLFVSHNIMWATASSSSSSSHSAAPWSIAIFPFLNLWIVSTDKWGLEFQLSNFEHYNWQVW